MPTGKINALITLLNTAVMSVCMFRWCVCVCGTADATDVYLSVKSVIQTALLPICVRTIQTVWLYVTSALLKSQTDCKDEK